jgi:hypothetical protein
MLEWAAAHRRSKHEKPKFPKAGRQFAIQMCMLCDSCGLTWILSRCRDMTRAPARSRPTRAATDPGVKIRRPELAQGANFVFWSLS